MERLTYDFCIGSNHCWQIKGADNFMCKEVCIKQGGDGCTNCPIKKAFDRLAAYEDTGLEPGEVLTGKEMAEVGCAIIRLKKYEDIGPIDHLRELAQAEKDGRLVMLPCRVGDVVYEANKRGFISTYKVISIHLSAYSTRIVWELLDGVYSNLNGFEASTLGKTVFLTREEAQAALEKREADNERI